MNSLAIENHTLYLLNRLGKGTDVVANDMNLP